MGNQTQPIKQNQFLDHLIVVQQEQHHVLLQDRFDGGQYCMKEFTTTNHDDLLIFKQMLEKKKLLGRHPNLLSVAHCGMKQADGYCTVSHTAYVIVEYPFRTLYDEVKERRANDLPFSQGQILSILYQCASALGFLYSTNQKHETLCSSRVFIDKSGLVRLCDPSLLKEADNVSRIESHSNSEHIYLSPEQLKWLQGIYMMTSHCYSSELSDIFTLGMIVLQMSLLEWLEETYDFKCLNKKRLARYLERLEDQYGQELTQLVSAMLQIDPKERLSFRDIICTIEQMEMPETEADTTATYKDAQLFSEPLKQTKKKKPREIQSYFHEPKPVKSFNTVFRRHLRSPSGDHVIQDQVKQSFQGRSTNKVKHVRGRSRSNQEHPKQFCEANVSKRKINLGSAVKKPPVMTQLTQNSEEYNPSFPNIKFNPNCEKLRKKQDCKKSVQNSCMQTSPPKEEPEEAAQSRQVKPKLTHPRKNVYYFPTFGESPSKQKSCLQSPPKLRVDSIEQLHQSRNSLQSYEQKNKKITFGLESGLVVLDTSDGQSTPPLTPLNSQQSEQIYQKIVESTDAEKGQCSSERMPLAVKSTNCQPEYVNQRYANGGRYEGYKLRGMRQGFGRFEYQNGGYYEGQWNRNKMEGFAKLFYQNGEVAYEGYWCDDMFNGSGRLWNDQPETFKSPFAYEDFTSLGNKWLYYDGYFVDDVRMGTGTIILTNGEQFQGEFMDDCVNGCGKFTTLDGTVVSGVWKQGRLV